MAKTNTPIQADQAQTVQRIAQSETMHNAPQASTQLPTVDPDGRVWTPIKIARPTPEQIQIKPDVPAWARLSFVDAKRDKKHGHYVCKNWLAIPDEDQGEGWVTGYQVMAELMELLSKNDSNKSFHYEARKVIEAAFAELSKPTKGRLNKKGAAGAIVHCLTHFMASVEMVSIGASRCTPVQNWIQAKIDTEQRSNAAYAVHKAKEKSAFVERMKLAKAAKRAQTLAAAKGGHAHE